MCVLNINIQFPLPPVRTLYGKPLTLYMMHFFHPRNLDIIKYTKFNAFLIFLALPPESYT